MALSIILPVYNESNTLAVVLSELFQFTESRAFQVIIVDDGSTDDSRGILEEFKENNHFHLVSHKLNRGYGAALKSGILATQTEAAIFFDADGQHDVADIERLYRTLIEHDADMVIGSRKGNKNESIFRKIGKTITRNTARLLMPLKVYDVNSGMKIFRTDLAKKYIRLCPDSMAFSDIFTLVFINSKHRVEEIPITIRKRIGGNSKITINVAFLTIMEIVNIIILFNPMRVFFPLFVLFEIAGIGWSMQFVLRGMGMSIGSSTLIISGFLILLLGFIAQQLSEIRKNR